MLHTIVIVSTTGRLHDWIALNLYQGRNFICTRESNYFIPLTRRITKSNNMPERRYGFFSCPSCNRGWESSYAWCYNGTDDPSSGQKCQSCPNEMVKPFKVERLKCSMCGSNAGCSCVRDAHHVDPAKPHRSDLCERCIKGQRCNYAR